MSTTQETAQAAGATRTPGEPSRSVAPGPGEILSLIRRHGSLTRGEIQHLTGYSRVTVGQRVGALVEAGLLREDGERSSGGRPATALRFDPAYGYFAVAVVETTRSRIALTDLAGTVLVSAEVGLRVGDGPRKCLDAIADQLTQLIAEHDVDPNHVHGIGISLPGPVDPTTLRPSEPPIMPGWDDFDVAERLRQSFDVSIVVENDANAMALGEQRGRFPRVQSLALIKVSTGIGAGIVIDGQLHQGVDGGAGDIGHIRIQGAEDALCRCGNQGCLAAIASGAAVARSLAAGPIAAETESRQLATGRDVRRLLDAGHGAAERAVAEAGATIGVVLAGLVSMLNPSVLVLSGDLASTALLGGVRSSLYRLTLPRATRHLEITLGMSGSAVRGLAAALVDEAFSPAAVNTAIRA